MFMRALGYYAEHILRFFSHFTRPSSPPAKPSRRSDTPPQSPPVDSFHVQPGTSNDHAEPNPFFLTEECQLTPRPDSGRWSAVDEHERLSQPPAFFSIRRETIDRVGSTSPSEDEVDSVDRGRNRVDKKPPGPSWPKRRSSLYNRPRTPHFVSNLVAQNTEATPSLGDGKQASHLSPARPSNSHHHHVGLEPPRRYISPVTSGWRRGSDSPPELRLGMSVSGPRLAASSSSSTNGNHSGLFSPSYDAAPPCYSYYPFTHTQTQRSSFVDENKNKDARPSKKQLPPSLNLSHGGVTWDHNRGGLPTPSPSFGNISLSALALADSPLSPPLTSSSDFFPITPSISTHFNTLSEHRTNSTITEKIQTMSTAIRHSGSGFLHYSGVNSAGALRVRFASSRRRFFAESSSGMVWLALYFAFNLGLTLYNKIVLGRFPYPYTLTALHALCGTLGSWGCMRRRVFVSFFGPSISPFCILKFHLSSFPRE